MNDSDKDIPGSLPPRFLTTSNSTAVSSVSSPFRSSSSTSLIKTGNVAFDRGIVGAADYYIFADVMETMDYFDCEIDSGYTDETSKIYSVLIKLPCYGPDGRTRDFGYLRVNACLTDDGKYMTEYSIEKKPTSMEIMKDESMYGLLKRAGDRSRRVYCRGRENPSIICFIDSLYYTLEETYHPGKQVIVRDFCYSVYDPRHWGRPLPGFLDRISHCSYRVRAKFDFDAAAEGELSIRKDDLLYVLADFGNGWLSVRRSACPSLDGTAAVVTNHNSAPPTGLVPENYVERIV